MKMRSTEKQGDAYRAVQHVYNSSPGRSWRGLNDALRDTLNAAITAHLSFEPGDFAAIVRDFNGGYWMGSGDGSACGEGYYSRAVKAGHTPACISFEQYAGRPAALWSESVKTPERLCVGSELTWGSHGLLTVTSMKKSYLVACSYTRQRFHSYEELAIGSVERLGGKCRQIESIASVSEESIVIRFSAPMQSPYESKVAHVVKITYEELAAARKAFDKARRNALGAIAAAETEPVLVEVMAGITSNPVGTYRHFDIEDIRKAAQERKCAIEKGAERKLDAERQEDRRRRLAESYLTDLEAWVAGEPARQWFRDVRLRVRDGWVETSTGQVAAVELVRRVLPVVLRRRNERGRVVNLAVGSHAVEQLTDEGVKVGCTWIPWGEVERLPSLLEVHDAR